MWGGSLKVPWGSIGNAHKHLLYVCVCIFIGSLYNIQSIKIPSDFVDLNAAAFKAQQKRCFFQTLWCVLLPFCLFSCFAGFPSCYKLQWACCNIIRVEFDRMRPTFLWQKYNWTAKRSLLSIEGTAGQRGGCLLCSNLQIIVLNKCFVRSLSKNCKLTFTLEKPKLTWLCFFSSVLSASSRTCVTVRSFGSTGKGY